PMLIDAVCALGAPYDIVVHDYAWVCPRITMIDGSGRYCGEPDVSVCEGCVRKNGSRLPRALSGTALRAGSAAWLGKARSVSAPSSDTAARYQRYFPDLAMAVRPHAPAPVSVPVPVPDMAPPSSPTPQPARTAKPLRIGLIGAIGSHKGY